jgi:hypothetical protein
MTTADGTDTPAPLFLVRGDASAEEVAALTVVVQGLAAGAAAGSEHEQPVGEWAAPHRLVRRTFPSGPGGWRSSALPR